MTTRLGVEQIQLSLDRMVGELHEAFEERLLAVVVYGSYARGTATPGSDVDLLVVVQGLPRDWATIHRLEDEWIRRGRRLGKHFQVMLASPEDVEDSVEGPAPLMLEIYNTHEIIFEQDGFFSRCIRRMRELMQERGIRMRKPGVWEVPERAVSR